MAKPLRLRSDEGHVLTTLSEENYLSHGTIVGGVGVAGNVPVGVSVIVGERVGVGVRVVAVCAWAEVSRSGEGFATA